ncbi:MAG: NAD(P)-dependent oxidoreductase [Candidatus Dojkabacteria bacterium]|nr:NAD(P)-dependent oxidoreductase [Candidatus Dojkabacteria bacterium]MDQ7020953.1 NAD(P)-dependent oxidoreductase [Candidatus Dojkabacteria bacterium]
MKKIGIIGLGIMGKGMTLNFLKNGYEVFVWNRTKSVSESIDHEKLTICSSPKEVTEQADIIFEVTANDESSEAVWYGESGILAGASTEKVLIVSSTLSIDYTDKLIKECERNNFKILDIPLTGGRVGAETGNLTLLCGGDEKLVNDLKPTFEAIAANVFYFGPSGSGMRYKLILNFVQGTHIVAFGQAMRIAKDQGMDLEKVGNGLAFRPGGVITEITNKSYFNEPNPVTFSVEWITKDLEYAKKMAKDLDVNVLDATLEKYRETVDRGLKDKDWTAVNN